LNLATQERSRNLEKLVLTTKDLDRVVTDLNIILDVRKNNTATMSEIGLDGEIELVKISLAKEITETQCYPKNGLRKRESVRAIRPYSTVSL